MTASSRIFLRFGPLPSSSSSISNLSDTKVRNFEPLSALTQLRTLDLSRTNVSDLSPLKSLNRLDTLIAQTIPIDKLAADVPNLDASIDLTPLASLPALREIDLSHSLIVDLEPLTRIQTLTWVRVTGSFTDTYNMKRLRRAIPGCRVEF